MSEHAEPERDVEEMEERSERLDDEIGDAREDWERKKADASVPGAVGDPEESEDDAELDPRDPANEDL
jgi:hypothetical protein